MDIRKNLPFSCNLIIAFVIVIYPEGQPGSFTDEASQTAQEEKTSRSNSISTDWSVSNADYRSPINRMTEDLECLALNIYFEARSEPALGRRAVGHVVMNRVNHRDFPDSICDVVRQGGSRTPKQCQFSWWCDGLPDKPYHRALWLKSLKLAVEIYTGRSNDPTGGALWYHADYANPGWSRTFQRGPKIGRHIFYRESRPRSNIL
ncbi:MAG: cell wall hydrolase [Methylococcaceae bacterium]|nr:cell wall hydrolase [Methylococcaceae bacterium]